MILLFFFSSFPPAVVRLDNRVRRLMRLAGLQWRDQPTLSGDPRVRRVYVVGGRAGWLLDHHSANARYPACLFQLSWIEVFNDSRSSSAFFRLLV